MQIDHVVLWVTNPLRALAFYVDVLGLEPVRREEYEAGKAVFPSVRLSEASILDLMDVKLAEVVRSGTGGGQAGGALNHICLSMDAAQYASLIERLEAKGVALHPGAAASFGARGISRHSVYFSDPDGNVVEIRHYED